MRRTTRNQGLANREGVVLLVVISLLVLFSLVGLAFVVYAQSQANTARLWREHESRERPDMDPELLLAYFLGQLIYDTDNSHSALRGHSLARNMYGRPGSTIPYSGTGRVHTDPNPAKDDFYNVDYTQYGGAARSPDQYGSPNPPYTYPDFNHMFLSAVRGSDGAVLIPSFVRVRPDGAAVTMRPDRNYHTAFPAQVSPSGDVRNRADGPGYKNGPHDSVWMDCGFPVMTAPDGRMFKPLFAPLIEDLDNRINVNVHGYWFIFGNGPNAAPSFQSNQGWAPWEVNPVAVLGNASEARNLMRGDLATGAPGRYDLTHWGQNWFKLSNVPDGYYKLPAGHFYAPTDLDCNVASNSNAMRLPSGANCFPTWQGTYGNGYLFSQNAEGRGHPRNYNYFSPEQNSWSNLGLTAQQDRRYWPGELEALLRYGDNGSPALQSQLFRLCPNIFNNAATRRLVTTDSIDVLRPGVEPWIVPGAPAYRLNPGEKSPTGGPTSFPAPGGSAPVGGEFSPNWTAVSAALRRIDLNRPLADYPAPDGTRKRITNPASFAVAQRERQDMARELFECLRQLTGANAAAPVDTPEYDAARWLAQLAANIVDFIDTDDYCTPFNWNSAFAASTENGWVFGAELPWIVVNEVYAEAVNDPSDTGSVATKDYKINFWVELYNSLNGNSSVNQQVVPFVENARARLHVPADGASPAYAAYQVAVAESGVALRQASNVTGKPDPAKLKTVLNDYAPGAPSKPLQLTGDNLNLVLPSAGAASGGTGRNEGYYLLGPSTAFPGTSGNASFFATLAVKDNGQPAGPARSGLTYELSVNADLAELPRHTILLRRLACPYLPPQENPALPGYNPYVTLDYLEEVPTNDAIEKDQKGARVPAAVNMRSAAGRKQPHAADKSQVSAQAPASQPAGQPKHTFFKINEPRTNPFQWLVALDRLLVSPAELLQVSAYKPHELTQQFVTTNAAGAAQAYSHRAPWFDADARIYRLFEFLEAGSRYQWSPIGGRTAGRFNVNTIWDLQTFRAICDPKGVNVTTAAGVDKLFNRVLSSRTPGGSPAAGDRPFRGFAVPHAPPGDMQYPMGSGIDDTLFRANPANPAQRLFEPDAADQASWVAGHPYLRYEMLRKMANHLTTRSHVFAVWVTVGFFEIHSSGVSGGPPVLGQEIGYAENRHVRRRMFAIVDRSSLTLDPTAAGKPGPRPFCIESQTPIVLNPPGQATSVRVDVPAVTGSYDGAPWEIRAGSPLIIDVGQNQETVIVTNVSFAPPSFTATFTRDHPVGVSVSNAVFGNPGPQPRFDMRNPTYGGVVRYFSIID